MKITVLIPSWNAEKYILRALRSVLDNGYDDFEVRIMDNLSTDGTKRLVAGLGDSRIHFASQADSGLYDALNKGIAAAKGEIICWLGADDQAYPGSLARVVAAFSDPQTLWVAGEGIFLHEGAQKNREFHQHLPATVDMRQIVYGNPLISPSVFFRRSFFERAGGFDPSYKLAADYDLWLRFARLSPPAVIRQPLSIFSYNGDNASSTSTVRMYRETLRAMQGVTEPELRLPRLANGLRLRAYIAYNHIRRHLPRR